VVRKNFATARLRPSPTSPSLEFSEEGYSTGGKWNNIILTFVISTEDVLIKSSQGSFVL
jgi:hypothetical protein